MSAVSLAAHYWLANKKPKDGSQVVVVDIGVAAAHRTAVAHHVADAAEISAGGGTRLAAAWLCGGSTVDGFALPDGTEVECVGCRLAAAVPAGPVVYYAWGDGDELLYVGSTHNVAQRIRAHNWQTPWWSDVRRLTFDEHATIEAARRAEYRAIYERPGRHNRDGRRGRHPQNESVLRVIEGGESA